MVWFVVGIVLFVTALLAFLASLALWVYRDAKVKSEQSPAIWVLIVLFVPNLIGLIIYLLVGRTNKNLPAPGTYKRLVIITAICFALAMGVFIGGTIRFATMDMSGSYGVRQIGSFVRHEDNLRNGVWTINADHANGYSRRTPVLTETELGAFHVSISSGGGNVSLRLEQQLTDIGSTHRKQTIDFDGDFDGFIDLRDFHEPGRIAITVEFDHAEDVVVTIRWR